MNHHSRFGRIAPMNRLPLFAAILVAAQLMGMSLPVAHPAPPAAPAPRPPNIVFFLCDDLGTGDVGALGGKDIQTPNIDALFARGTRLTWHWRATPSARRAAACS